MTGHIEVTSIYGTIVITVPITVPVAFNVQPQILYLSPEQTKELLNALWNWFVDNVQHAKVDGSAP